jgi:hypothetical protein
MKNDKDRPALVVALVFTKALFGTALIIGAAGMWHYWNANGFLMTALGAVGLIIIADAFDFSLQ